MKIRNKILIPLLALIWPLPAAAQKDIGLFSTERQHISGTPLLTPERIRIADENTRRMYPVLSKTGLEQPAWYKAGAVPNLNDEIQLWAYDYTTDSHYSVTAVLKRKGSMVYIWAEKESIENGKVTDLILDDLMENFENSTPAGSIDQNKGIIGIERDFFGSEPNKDGDGISDIFLLDIKDFYGTGGVTSFVSGYFYSKDQKDQQHSNQRDMLYLDLYPAIERGVVLMTAAHEYQHLIHYNYDTDEITFINEGASQLAQIVTGQGWDDPQLYLNNTDRYLLDWEQDESNSMVLSDYARAQVFMLYLWEQLGDDFIKDLVQDPANGLTTLTLLLGTYGGGRTFQDIVQDWFIANYVNDISINPAYGYSYYQAQNMKVPAEKTVNNYPKDELNGQVSGFAVDYVKFKNGRNLNASYTGNIKLYAMHEVNNVPVVSELTPGMMYTDSTMNIDHTETVFAYINTEDITTGYTYSVNADQAYFVREVKYDDGTPDVITGSATGLQHTQRDAGYGWAVKFEALNDESYLLGAKAYVSMDTVENGSPRMKFRVYDDTGPDGAPGNDIIPPQIITLAHTQSFVWLEVDLTDYHDTLSEYHGDFYISLEHSDTENNRFGIAVDNSDKTECFSYVLYGPTHSSPGWASFTELIVTTDGDPVELGDYDLMIRAEMAFLDDEPPVLTGGFLQNPVFTENFDVYLTGTEPLNSATVTGSISVNGSEADLDLVSSGSSGKVFVDNDITITESGTVTLDFSSMSKFGFLTSDTTISFTLQGVEPGMSSVVSSISGSAKLEIGSGDIPKKMMMSAVDGFSSPFMSSSISPPGYNSIPVTDPVTFGPKITTNDNVRIIFKFPELLPGGKNEEALYIAYLKDNVWIPVSSSIDRERRIVITYTKELGTFQLWAGDIPDIQVPEEFILKQNYPNPFNPSTMIEFGLKEPVFVSLKIYNVLGEEIRTLISDPMEAGMHHISWDGRNDLGMSVGTGVYFYRISAGKFSDVKKMILIK